MEMGFNLDSKKRSSLPLFFFLIYIDAQFSLMFEKKWFQSELSKRGNKK